MTGKELLRLLRSHGWEVQRIAGSHHMMCHPDKPGMLIPVPVHSGEIATGTMHRILRLAGIK